MSTSSPRIVLVHGVWDLLHAGHIEHLRQASEFGTELVVSVVPDRFCGKRKPIIPQEDRVSILHSIRYVWRVVLCDGPGPEKVIEKFRPQVYVRPIDYAGKEMPENKILRELRIPLAFTYPISIHTSDIIARIKESA